MTEQPPSGRIADILEWVNNDPERAQAALDAEQAGANRPRLITRLKSITAQKESTMSADPTAPTADPHRQETTGDQATADARDDERDEVEEVPAPEPPEEVLIYAEDAGTIIHPVAVRDPEFEVPEDAIIAADPEYDRTPEAAQARGRRALDDADVQPISGDQVEFITGASATNGLILNVNGSSFALSPQQVGQLKQIVDRAVVGLAL